MSCQYTISIYVPCYSVKIQTLHKWWNIHAKLNMVANCGPTSLVDVHFSMYDNRAHWLCRLSIWLLHTYHITPVKVKPSHRGGTHVTPWTPLRLMNHPTCCNNIIVCLIKWHHQLLSCIYVHHNGVTLQFWNMYLGVFRSRVINQLQRSGHQPMTW